MVFTTRPEPEVKTTVSVSHTDANADFYTLQGAVDFFTRNAVEGEKTIMLDEGKFEEIVNIRNLSNLTVKGAGADKTEIQSDNNNNWNPGIKDGCDSGLADALKPGMDIPYVDGRNQGGGRAGVLIAGKADKIRLRMSVCVACIQRRHKRKCCAFVTRAIMPRHLYTADFIVSRIHYCRVAVITGFMIAM